MTTVAIMGSGRIGGEVAFICAARGLADRVVLYDINNPLLEAQALDLVHTGLDINISTDKEDIYDSDIAVLSAGIPRTPAVKTRADLINANLPAAREFAELISGFDGIAITVTNPADIINYLVCSISGVERFRCIGFGGQLDSARFSNVLSHRGIDEQGVVLGEHGEHQVPVFSTLGQEVGMETREEILSVLRGASMPIIKGKGGTVFGPVWQISELIRALAGDTRAIVPCSCVLEGEYGQKDCSLCVPSVVGRDGIISIQEWDLDRWEELKINEAGKFLRSFTGIVQH